MKTILALTALLAAGAVNLAVTHQAAAADKLFNIPVADATIVIANIERARLECPTMTDNDLDHARTWLMLAAVESGATDPMAVLREAKTMALSLTDRTDRCEIVQNVIDADHAFWKGIGK